MKILKQIWNNIKYNISRFRWMKVFNSPFIRPKLKLYFGKIQHGTPYFFPRKWVKHPTKKGYSIAVPKKIGFDFVSLGWKTKWSDTDYRYEWGPIWSFVFIKWQICLFFIVPEPNHYWTSWLFYEYNTDKTKDPLYRITECKLYFPQEWKSFKEGEIIITDYYNKILK